MSATQTSLLQQQALLSIESAIQDSISGSHILHHHGLLDAFGHLSVRHPTRHDVFIMPRNLAPALITSRRDLVEYYVANAAPVDTTAPPGYIERYIHSEIYKKYPDVQSVVHSHSPAVLPYGIAGVWVHLRRATGLKKADSPADVPLRACLHMAGFLGHSTPVFDIEKYHDSSDVKDLLVRNERQGHALARCFSNETDPNRRNSQHEIDHFVVLMRGHGMTVVGSSIQECVYRAIYTQENAAVQTTALTLHAAAGGRGQTSSGLHYLGDEVTAATARTNLNSWGRAWPLWVREVEATGLYVHQH